MAIFRPKGFKGILKGIFEVFFKRSTRVFPTKKTDIQDKSQSEWKANYRKFTLQVLFSFFMKFYINLFETLNSCIC